MKEMNILYAIDEQKKDYSRYLGISILSLLEHNKDENIHIYILSEYIEESNKQELIRIVENFGKKIYFSEGKIVPEKFKKVLRLTGSWPIAMYYRWFFNKCFDIKDRILYLDCDTIVNKNLSEFYYQDFKGSVIIGNLDIPVTLHSRKIKYGLTSYINSGVMLINIDLFNKIDLYNGVIHINEKYVVDYPDQDYINLILNNKIKVYNNLQCIIYYKRQNYKYDEYLIFHTVAKPNYKNESPKKIENLFDKYLQKTKRKNYKSHNQKLSGIDYFTSNYIMIGRFFEYIFQLIFGGIGGYYVKVSFGILLNIITGCYNKIIK